MRVFLHHFWFLFIFFLRLSSCLFSTPLSSFLRPVIPPPSSVLLSYCLFSILFALFVLIFFLFLYSLLLIFFSLFIITPSFLFSTFLFLSVCSQLFTFSLSHLSLFPFIPLLCSLPFFLFDHSLSHIHPSLLLLLSFLSSSPLLLTLVWWSWWERDWAVESASSSSRRWVLSASWRSWVRPVFSSASSTARVIASCVSPRMSVESVIIVYGYNMINIFSSCVKKEEGNMGDNR